MYLGIFVTWTFCASFSGSGSSSELEASFPIGNGRGENGGLGMSSEYLVVRSAGAVDCENIRSLRFMATVHLPLKQQRTHNKVPFSY